MAQSEFIDRKGLGCSVMIRMMIIEKANIKKSENNSIFLLASISIEVEGKAWEGRVLLNSKTPKT